jgi:hypothetical protein
VTGTLYQCYIIHPSAVSSPQSTTLTGPGRPPGVLAAAALHLSPAYKGRSRNATRGGLAGGFDAALQRVAKNLFVPEMHTSCSQRDEHATNTIGKYVRGTDTG